MAQYDLEKSLSGSMRNTKTRTSMSRRLRGRPLRRLFMEDVVPTAICNEHCREQKLQIASNAQHVITLEPFRVDQCTRRGECTLLISFPAVSSPNSATADDSPIEN